MRVIIQTNLIHKKHYTETIAGLNNKHNPSESDKLQPSSHKMLLLKVFYFP